MAAGREEHTGHALQGGEAVAVGAVCRVGHKGEQVVLAQRGTDLLAGHMHAGKQRHVRGETH